MNEIVFAYVDGEWKVQLLANGNFATQPQFQYSIYPTPDDPNIGFIIESQSQGTEVSRILFYDLAAKVENPDGSFSYCGIAELARYAITLPISPSSNMPVDVRGMARLPLSPQNRAAVDRMYAEMFSYAELPLEPVVILSQREFFERERIMHVLDAERQRAYAAYIQSEHGRKLAQDVWIRFQSSLQISDLTRRMQATQLGGSMQQAPTTAAVTKKQPNTARARRPAAKQQQEPAVTKIMQREESKKDLRANQQSEQVPLYQTDSNHSESMPAINLPPPPKPLHKKNKKSSEERAAQQLLATKENFLTILAQPNIDLNKLFDLTATTTFLKAQGTEQLVDFFATINFPIKIIELLIRKDDKIVPQKIKLALLKKVLSYSNEDYDTLRQPLNLINKINALVKQDYANAEETAFVLEMQKSLQRQYDGYIARKPQKINPAIVEGAKSTAASKQAKPPKPIELLIQSFENLDYAQAADIIAKNSGLKSQIPNAFNDAFADKDKNFDLARAESFVKNLDIDVKFCLKALQNPKLNTTITAAVLQKLMQFEGIEFYRVYQAMDRSPDFELMLEEVRSLYPEVTEIFYSKVAAAKKSASAELTRLLSGNPKPELAQLQPYLHLVSSITIDGDNALVYALKNLPPNLALVILKASTNDMLLSLDAQQRSILHVFAGLQSHNPKLFREVFQRFHEALNIRCTLGSTNGLQIALQYLLDKDGKTYLDVMLERDVPHSSIANLINETSALFSYNQTNFISKSWLQLIPILTQKSISLSSPETFKKKLDTCSLITRQIIYAYSLLAKPPFVFDDNEQSDVINDVFNLRSNKNIIAQLVEKTPKDLDSLLQQIIKMRLIMRSELNLSIEPMLHRIFMDNDIKHALYDIFRQDTTPEQLATAAKIIKIDMECCLEYLTTTNENEFIRDNPERLQPTLLQVVLNDIATNSLEFQAGIKLLNTLLQVVEGDRNNPRNQIRKMRFIEYEDGNGETCLDNAFAVMVKYGVNEATRTLIDKLLVCGASLNGENLDGLNNLLGENILHRLFATHGADAEPVLDYMLSEFDKTDLLEKLQQRTNEEEDLPTPIEVLKELDQTPALVAFIEKLENMLQARNSPKNLM